LIKQGGVATTLVPTGQQWDFPNSWPPLVLLTIEGLGNLADVNSNRNPPEAVTLATAMAANISSTWLQTNYAAYATSGYMYEKYDSQVVGGGGSGGEYTPQVGFGWSNAVALLLLQQSYPASPPSAISTTEGEFDYWAIATVGIVFVVGAVLVVAFNKLRKCYTRDRWEREHLEDQSKAYAMLSA
jgi:hypothetical protein